MATVADYPSRSTAYWLKQLPVPPDFSASLSTHQFDDGGMSFNDAGGSEPTWELTYDGLGSAPSGGFSAAAWAALDAHYASARLSNDFTFTDRDGVAHTGVRYKSYERDHKQYDAQSRKVVLIQYP